MNQNDELNVPTSNTKSTYESTHIRPGTYALQLTGAKAFKDDKGQWIKPEFGQRVKLTFDVFKITYDDSNDEDPGTVTKPVTIKRENIERDVQLSLLVNIAYTKTDFETKVPIKGPNGEFLYQTALKPTAKGPSKPSLVFMALGWKGPDGNPLQISSLIGNWVQGSVSDYQPKDKDGNDMGEPQSQIVKESLTPLKAHLAPELQTKKTVTEEPLKVVEENLGTTWPEKVLFENDDFVVARKKDLAEGLITQRGYDIAIEQYRKSKA